MGNAIVGAFVLSQSRHCYSSASVCMGILRLFCMGTCYHKCRNRKDAGIGNVEKGRSCCDRFAFERDRTAL